jgi:hypothetical protein
MSQSNQENNPQRRLVQTRQIEVKVYRREDELWDIEAQLTDLKGKDFQLSTNLRPFGDPIHQMVLKLTINTSFDVLEADAITQWSPYPGFCESIGPDYGKLVGLNLIRRFRDEARERIGGVHGCTHISELIKVIPTAAIQAFVGEIYPVALSPETTKKPDQKIPMHFNGCHALRTDGPLVQQYHPVWYGYPVKSGA